MNPDDYANNEDDEEGPPDSDIEDWDEETDAPKVKSKTGSFVLASQYKPPKEPSSKGVSLRILISCAERRV